MGVQEEGMGVEEEFVLKSRYRVLFGLCLAPYGLNVVQLHLYPK